MKPICVKCQRFYRPKRNGVRFVENMPTILRAAPGTTNPENWTPYKVWQADLWECKGCHHELICGAGACPIAIDHEQNFQQALETVNFIVNDC